MSTELPKTFCPLAWNQIHVTPIGVVKPCCVFDGALLGENQKAVRINDGDLESVWNGDAFRKLRLKMLSGEEIKECKKCYEEEKISNYSERTRALWANPVTSNLINDSRATGVVTTGPTSINLKIGNKCNLKCRMCQPLDSGMIDAEFTEISRLDPRFRSFDNANAFDYNYDEIPIEFASDWIKDETAKENIYKLLSSTDKLSIAGGETTFTEEAIEILKFCVEKKIAKNIIAVMSSNLTRISDDLISLMAEFKCFRVIASIDGVGGLAEYIRYPTKWNIVKNNFIKLVNAPSNVVPVVAPTIQIYNILNIVDVFDFVEEINSSKWEANVEPACHLTILFDPQHLSIRHLPQKIKLVALERLLDFKKRSSILNHTMFANKQFDLLLDTLRDNTFNSDGVICSREYMSYFMQYTLDLDMKRHQRLQDYIPELYKLLLEENITPLYPKNDPRNYTFYKYRDTGFRLHSENNIAEAIRMFSRAYEMFQKDPDLLLSLGICYKKLEDRVMAYKILCELIEVSPNNTYGLTELGTLLMSDNKFNEALPFLQRAKNYATPADGQELKKLIEECQRLL